MAATGSPRGCVVPAITMYAVAADWYRGRDGVGWIRHDADAASEIFRRHGLIGEFWEI